MLAKEKPDVVLNYTDNIERAEVTEYLAAQGLPQMVEKPMAYSLKDADRMLKAAQKYNNKLMINWPSMWSPGLRKAYQLYKDGVLGDLVHHKTRAAHYSTTKENYPNSYDFQWMGTKEAGGAFLDFTCYGTAFTVWLAGMPKAVMATAGNFVKDFIPGPDCGILIMLYDKATAEIEASWNQIGRVPSPTVIYGTKASLSLGATINLYTLDNPDGEEIQVDPLPKGESGPIEYFLTAVMKDKPIGGLCDPKVSRDAQEVMEAGLISAARGKVIPLPLSPRMKR
jgi:predicted dehydrogenase